MRMPKFHRIDDKSIHPTEVGKIIHMPSPFIVTTDMPDRGTYPEYRYVQNIDGKWFFEPINKPEQP